MSALTQTRDHARAMAAREPYDLAAEPGMRCQLGEHGRCLIGPSTCPCSCHDGERPPVPTEAERAVWTQIADEIDEYLAGPPTAVDLFGAETTEPEAPRALCDPLPDDAEPPTVRTYADPSEPE